MIPVGYCIVANLHAEDRPTEYWGEQEESIFDWGPSNRMAVFSTLGYAYETVGYTGGAVKKLYIDEGNE